MKAEDFYMIDKTLNPNACAKQKACKDEVEEFDERTCKCVKKGEESWEPIDTEDGDSRRPTDRNGDKEIAPDADNL